MWLCTFFIFWPCVVGTHTELYLTYKAGFVSLRNALHKTTVENLGSGSIAVVSHCTLGKDDYRSMHDWVQGQLPSSKNVTRACRLEMVDQLREEWLGWFRWCNFSNYEAPELDFRSWKSHDAFNRVSHVGNDEEVMTSLPRIAYVLVLPELSIPFSFRQMSALWAPENTLAYVVSPRDVVATSNAAAALGSNVFVARIEGIFQSNAAWIVYRAMAWLSRRRSFDFLVVPRPGEYPRHSPFQLSQLLASLKGQRFVLTSDEDDDVSGTPSSGGGRKRSVASRCCVAILETVASDTRLPGSHGRSRAFVSARRVDRPQELPFAFAAEIVRDFTENVGVRRLISFLKYSDETPFFVYKHALRSLDRQSTTNVYETSLASGENSIFARGASLNSTLLDWIDETLLGDQSRDHQSFSLRVSEASTAGDVEVAKSVYLNARVKLAHSWNNAH